MKIQMSFDLFVQTVKNVLDFEEDWDTEEWNVQYINFKDGVNYYGKDYLKRTGTIDLITAWAVDFYQDATYQTHDYWVKKIFLTTH